MVRQNAFCGLDNYRLDVVVSAKGGNFFNDQEICCAGLPLMAGFLGRAVLSSTVKADPGFTPEENTFISQVQASETRVSLVVRPHWVLRGFSLGAVVLVAAYFAVVAVLFLGVSGVRMYASVDLESDNNLATWFSAAQHLVNAALFGLLAVGDTGRDRRRWAALGVLVLLVSAGEIATVHEHISAALQSVLHTSGFLLFAWVIPASIVVLVLAIIFTGFLLRQPPPAGLLIVGAGVFVAGALGMEMVGAWWFDQFGHTGVGYYVLVGIEESLEMLGCLIAMRGLLGLLEGRTIAIGLSQRRTGRAHVPGVATVVRSAPGDEPHAEPGSI